MKCEIKSGILVVSAESLAETEELKAWRAEWHRKPKAEIWFKCLYYEPAQTA